MIDHFDDLDDPRAASRADDPPEVAAARAAYRAAALEVERLRELRLAATAVRDSAELAMDNAELAWACPRCRHETELGPEYPTCRECSGSGWRRA